MCSPWPDARPQTEIEETEGMCSPWASFCPQTEVGETEERGEMEGMSGHRCVADGRSFSS